MLNHFNETRPGNNGSVTVTVKGSIVDEAGEPLIGVNIAAMSTGKGTISDINGEFTVEAAKMKF